MMGSQSETIPVSTREARRHLALSREEPARKLGSSFASVNRWENSQFKPSKLARDRLDEFLCKDGQIR